MITWSLVPDHRLCSKVDNTYTRPLPYLYDLSFVFSVYEMPTVNIGGISMSFSRGAEFTLEGLEGFSRVYSPGEVDVVDV